MPCNHTTLYTTLYAVKYAGPQSLPPAAAAAAAAARDSSALPYIYSITPITYFIGIPHILIEHSQKI